MDDLFDFPCSYTFRRYAAYYNEDRHLPHLEEPTQTTIPTTQPNDWQHQLDRINAWIAYEHDRITKLYEGRKGKAAKRRQPGVDL